MTQEHCRGWLQNPARKARREQAQTLTDRQVLELLDKIDSFEKYSKLDQDADLSLRMRDKAVVALGWIYFKRGTELLHVRLGEIYYDKTELVVTFNIEKKIKHMKICPSPSCKTKNGIRSRFCSKCGISLATVIPIAVGDQTARKVTKRKDLRYPFCKPVTEWLDHLRDNEIKDQGWIFPRYHYFSRGFQFYAEKPITYQRLDQILQKLDPSLTSHMFRYGATERLYRKGFTTIEIMEMGDWSSPIMPIKYAQRKGLTPSQKKFTKDIEII